MSKIHIERLKQIDIYGNINDKSISIMLYPIDTAPDIIGITLNNGKINLVKRVNDEWSTIWSK